MAEYHVVSPILAWISDGSSRFLAFPICHLFSQEFWELWQSSIVLFQCCSCVANTISMVVYSCDALSSQSTSWSFVTFLSGTSSLPCRVSNEYIVTSGHCPFPEYVLVSKAVKQDSVFTTWCFIFARWSTSNYCLYSQSCQCLSLFITYDRARIRCITWWSGGLVSCAHFRNSISSNTTLTWAKISSGVLL